MPRTARPRARARPTRARPRARRGRRRPRPPSAAARRGRDRAACCFATGGGVMDAQGLVALVDAVEAVGGAHAGPDRVLLAGPDLPHDVRVGDVRPCHADHVELARGDRVPGGGHVGDAGGVEHRQARGARISPAKSRCGADGMPMIGMTCEAACRVDVAADDVEEVDEAAAAKRRPISKPSSLLEAVSQRSSPVMRMPIRNRSRPPRASLPARAG